MDMIHLEKALALKRKTKNIQKQNMKNFYQQIFDIL